MKTSPSSGGEPGGNAAGGGSMWDVVLPACRGPLPAAGLASGFMPSSGASCLLKAAFHASCWFKDIWRPPAGMAPFFVRAFMGCTPHMETRTLASQLSSRLPFAEVPGLLLACSLRLLCSLWSPCLGWRHLFSAPT